MDANENTLESHQKQVNLDLFYDDDMFLFQLKEAMLQLQLLKLEIQGQAAESSPEVGDIGEVNAGLLLTLVTELRALINGRLSSQSSTNSMVI